MNPGEASNDVPDQSTMVGVAAQDSQPNTAPSAHQAIALAEAPACLDSYHAMETNSSTDQTVASEAQLEDFARQPFAERQLLAPLRGVLAEAALTGVVRYEWALVRPLVEFAMEQVMRLYDAQGQADVGPSLCASYGETVSQTIDRFKMLLSGFGHTPWTFQRLCEILLEPHKQYTKLHKVALAIEKCLMVTGEVPLTAEPPPPPLLSALRPVNENPPAVYQSASEANRAAAQGRTAAAGHVQDESAAFVDSLIEVKSADTSAAGPSSAPKESSSQQQRKAHANHASSGQPTQGHAQGQKHAPQAHGHAPAGIPSSLVEHMEEDHWPENGPSGFHAGGIHIMGHGFHQQHNHHSHNHQPSRGGEVPPRAGSPGRGSPGGSPSHRPGASEQQQGQHGGQQQQQQASVQGHQAPWDAAAAGSPQTKHQKTAAEQHVGEAVAAAAAAEVVAPVQEHAGNASGGALPLESGPAPEAMQVV